MTTINVVSKTGMAIEMARRIIDVSLPQERDLAREYEYAKWAPLYNLAHSGIENGIKALIWQIDSDHPGGHNLRSLFRKLKGKAPKKARLLEDAFSDIVNFYTIDTRRWVYFNSLDAYLKEFGSEKRYETYRYWALDNKDLEYIPLFAHRELLAFLERLCQWGQRMFTSRRVELNVNGVLHRKIERHANHCDTCRKASVGPSMTRLLASFPSVAIIADRINDAYNRKFDNRDDECADKVMQATFECLKTSEDPAVQYYFNRLTDLPEGSITRPSDAELEVDQHGVVKIRTGETVGMLHHSMEGLWYALISSPESKARIAKTKEDAMYWLLAERTEMVQISVDGGAFTPKRAMSSPSYVWVRSESSSSPGYKITFADESHGLTVGQFLDIRSGTSSVLEFNGPITRISGREVFWG